MNKLLICGGLLGLLAVFMGATLDHFVTLSDAETASVMVGIRYNMLYALLIAAIGLAPTKQYLQLSGAIFAIGTCLFSISIYLTHLTPLKQLVYLVPFGGVTIMLAWVLLIMTGVKWRTA